MSASEHPGERVVFLDRDGTINIDHGYVHRVEDFELLPGVVDGLAILQDAGFRLAVVTNQSGIAAGRYGDQDVQQLHTYMRELFASYGISLDAIAYCPHEETDRCDCRKPGIAMAGMIESHLAPINYQNSWMVGDKPSDIEFGRRLGMQTALLASSYWTPDSLSTMPSLVEDSVLAVTNKIVLQRDSNG